MALSPDERRRHLREACRRYYLKNKQRTHDARLVRRQRILDAYGNRCARCGFDDPRALQLDHINGGGRQHILSFSSVDRYYNWVVQNEFPTSLQLLCANCNRIKQHENQEWGGGRKRVGV